MAVNVGVKPPEPLIIDVEPEQSGFQVVSSIEPESPMPDFPAKTIRADKQHLFFDWIKSLEEHHRSRISIYLYRAWPVIDRKKSNPDSSINIDVLNGYFTVNDILRNHGGGEYKFLVNDVNKAVNGKGGTLGHAYANFVGADYPDPILKLDELDMDARNNRSYIDKLKAQNILTSEGKVMQAAAPISKNDDPALIALLGRLIEKMTQPNQQPLAKDPASDISKMFIDANSAVVGMLREQVKTDSPAQLVTMLSAFKELIPKPENNNNTLELIMKMMGDAQVREAAATERFMALLMKEPVDAESKVLEKMSLYKELFGGGEGHTPKKSTFEVVMENVAPLVFKGAEMVVNVLNMKNYKQGLEKQATQMPPVGPQPTQNESQPQIEGSNIIEMPQQPQQTGDELSEALGQYGSFILNGIQRGDTGDAFADSVSTMLGPLTYKKIASVGKEGLLAAMKGTPAFWQGVNKLAIPETVLVEWIADFVSFGDPEPEGEVTA